MGNGKDKYKTEEEYKKAKKDATIGGFISGLIGSTPLGQAVTSAASLYDLYKNNTAAQSAINSGISGAIASTPIGATLSSAANLYNTYQNASDGIDRSPIGKETKTAPATPTPTVDDPLLELRKQIQAETAYGHALEAQRAGTIGMNKTTPQSESKGDKVEDEVPDTKSTKSSAPQVTYESAVPTGVTSSPIAGVDTDTYNGMFQQYAPSADVQRATALTQAQLDKLMEGRTQYTDKLNSLIDAYGNRDSFAYDPNADMLYQNYLSAMQNAGQMAMKDTMGQAAALTGGYGSTYATAAANGAYNNYLQTANDNLVNFYNMALDRYKLEGDEALQNINLAQMQDSTEWNRMLNEYEAAFNRENTLYGRDYQNFADQVNQYNTRASMLNSDFWKDQSNKLATDQFNAEMDYKYNVLDDNAAARAQEQENWQKEFDFNVEQSEAKTTNAIIEAAQKQAAEESSNDAKWGGRTNAQITKLYLDAYNVIKSAGRNEEKQRKALVSFFDTQNNLSEEAIADIETWLDNVVSGKVKVNKWED